MQQERFGGADDHGNMHRGGMLLELLKDPPADTNRGTIDLQQDEAGLFLKDDVEDRRFGDTVDLGVAFIDEEALDQILAIAVVISDDNAGLCYRSPLSAAGQQFTPALERP